MVELILCKSRSPLILAAALILYTPAAQAQIQSVDPNEVIDADIVDPPDQDGTNASEQSQEPMHEELPAPQTDEAPGTVQGATDTSTTYQKKDVLSAAEEVFGKGAEGLAKLIEDILKKQGQPNAYIVGREGGGAFLLGLRYGSGELRHKVEGNSLVYWAGPSLGFDAGANAGSTFVLVYNLYDSSDLYHRFPSGEGVAYLIGGFNASYLRRGDVVLIPIRVGVGIRLGANVGYMKFSKKQRWLPF